MKKRITKILTSAVAMIMCFSMLVQPTMAAETSPKVSVNDTRKVSWPVDGVFGAGVDTWLESRHINSVGNGGIFTYNAEYIKLKPAWRPSDSTTSQEELEIRVYRKWQNQLVYARRFLLTDDTDGHADASGWWYCETPWIKINKGSDYYVQYELYTARGYNGTGSNRQGDVSVWVATKN